MKALVIILYVSKMSIREIVKLFDVSPTAIQNWIREFAKNITYLCLTFSFGYFKIFQLISTSRFDKCNHILLFIVLNQYMRSNIW